MTPTLITAKNGQARPVNPFEGYQTNAVGDNTWKRTQEWKDFESTVQWHDCPEATEDGEYTGYLQWQAQNPINDVWCDCGPGYLAVDTRQVWRIVQQPQEPSGRVKKLHAMSIPMKEGDRFKKEEAKTVEGKCQCEICKMTIGEAKQLAFMNYLLAEITIEDYDHINQMLNDYATSKRNYRRTNACSYDSKGNSLFARNK